VASGVEVDIWPHRVPHLPGAEDVVRAGIVSTLQPQNLRAADAVAGLRLEQLTQPEMALLFDPQTAGGLLAGIPPDRVDACLTALHDAGYAEAMVVGVVRRWGSSTQAIRVASHL
jgi:selenide,water dikinase